MRHIRALIVLYAAMSFLGCHEGLYHDLDEQSANEIVVALHQAGVEAEKVDGKAGWNVEIPRGSTTVAMHALQQRGLPRPQVQGFAEVYPAGGLVPSPQEEQALFQFATAEEVRRGLLTIDGVVDAHVTLVLPRASRRGQPPAEPPRGSAVITWRADGEAPLAETDAKRLIAAGVPGLSADRVEVLFSQLPQSESAPRLDLVEVGPLTVPAPQKSTTQLVLAGLISGILVLALMLIAFVRGGQRA